MKQIVVVLMSLLLIYMFLCIDYKIMCNHAICSTGHSVHIRNNVFPSVHIKRLARIVTLDRVRSLESLTRCSVEEYVNTRHRFYVSCGKGACVSKP